MRRRRWPILGVFLLVACLVAMSARVHTYGGFVSIPSGDVIAIGWHRGVFFAGNLSDDAARGHPLMVRCFKLSADAWEWQIGALLVGYPDGDNVRRMGDFAAASWNVTQTGTTLPDRSHWISLPLWCPLLIVGGYILLRVIWIVRSARPGFCRGCGYDLRESVGVCPECGAPFKAVPATARPAGE